MKARLVCLASLCLALVLAIGTGGAFPCCASSEPEGVQVTLATRISDPVEILFQIGLNEARQGNYPSAVRIFESLTKQSASPRIRLELARALFLDRRYEESAQVFAELLLRPELPWTVQENIRAYLEAIEAARGYVRFGFSLVSDSNPRNFTDSQQIRIAGQPLKIIPPHDNQEIRGIRYAVNGARILTRGGSLAGYLNAFYADFPNSQFDRWTADLGLFLSSRRWPKVKLKAGIEESWYGGEHLYEFPYAGLIYTPDPVLQFRASSEFKIGQLRVPKAGHLDATHLTLTAVVSRALTDAVRASGDLYLEKAITDEQAYAYEGGALGAGLSFAVFEGWGLRPYASIGRRIYAAKDPFFGGRRRDTRTTAGLKISKQLFSLFGFLPEIEFRYDENRSNLDYYSYDKVVFQLNFNKPL